MKPINCLECGSPNCTHFERGRAVERALVLNLLEVILEKERRTETARMINAIRNGDHNELENANFATPKGATP